MIRRPPRSTLFPTRRSSDLLAAKPPEDAAEVLHPHGVQLVQAGERPHAAPPDVGPFADRKSTRLNSSHSQISHADFCFKKKKIHTNKRHQQDLNDSNNLSHS